MILEAMRRRRSVRAFRPDPVPRELLEKLVEAASTAPSASNKQPWRFLVVLGAERIAAMAAAVREAVDRIARHIEPEWEHPFRAYGDYFTRFESAPAVIVPLARPITVLSHMVRPEMDPADRGRVLAMERDSGLVSASLAIENLLLQASELGLGASAMTGPLVASDRIRAILSVPASWELLALVPVGYPAEEPAPTSRKPVDQIIRWIE